MTSQDSLPDYEDIDEISEPLEKKYKLNDKKMYKKPAIIPHYIIVGHGQVREFSTFQNNYNATINYFCTRGNVMLGFIHHREFLIDQMNKMCNKNIISKETLKYGEEIDNTEYSATNEIEERLFGIYTCDNLDAPIYRFILGRRYTLEELLYFINNYTINTYQHNYFEVSILGCRPVDNKPYTIPTQVHTERLTGSKRKYSQIAGKRKYKSKRKYN